MKAGVGQSTNQIAAGHTYEAIDKTGPNYDVINSRGRDTRDTREHTYNVLEHNGPVSHDSQVTQGNATPQDYEVPQ